MCRHRAGTDREMVPGGILLTPQDEQHIGCQILKNLKIQCSQAGNFSSLMSVRMRILNLTVEHENNNSHPIIFIVGSTNLIAALSPVKFCLNDNELVFLR